MDMESKTQPVASEPEVQQSPESQTAEPAADLDNKVDWWNPDTWGKTPTKEIVKQIQSKYNEKSEKAKKAESLEKDYHNTRAELEKLVQDVRAALQDPKVYNEQRRKLGYVVEEEPKAPDLDFSKLETVGDVVNSFNTMKEYFERRLHDVERAAETRAENKIRQAVDPISKERWSVALENMKSKYGDAWDKVQAKVAQAITNGRYAYTPGSEKEVLDKAFRAECPDEYEAVVLDKFRKKAEEKATKTTAAPKPSAQRIKPKGGTADDIIARVNARLGPAR